MAHLASSPALPPATLAHFCAQSIVAPIAGFLVSEFPLWKLGCLLDEDWLEEDIVNSLCELMYFRIAATSSDIYPSCLFLPTYFFSDARRLYNHSSHSFSPNILALRQRLLNTRVSEIAFIICERNHYSGGGYSPTNILDSSYLNHGDSLAVQAPGDMLDIFQWFIEDISISVFPLPISVQEVATPLQGLRSGSCGIAALNFIERQADPTVPLWSNSQSSIFRHTSLRNLVLYHCLALNKGVSSVIQV